MTGNPFTSTALSIAPSILSADFANLPTEIRQVLDWSPYFLHRDGMDGRFSTLDILD